MMRIAVRADASVRIGTGHVMRCLALAGALRDGGAEVRFICRAHPGHLIDRIEDDGFAVSPLTAPDPDDTSWLGASVEADAAKTIAALDGWRPDWLVVDHYALGADWERAIRPHVGAVLAVDDLADRAHDCDVLLDQNHHPEAEGRYAGLVPQTCRLLCGPWFALLRPEYATMRRLLDGPRTGPVARVLVFYGGSDPTNETARALRVLSELPFSALAVDVVMGANHPDRTGIAALVAARPNTTLHGPRPHLADLMARADLALGAGGATTWERCCLGLATIATTTAENQTDQMMRMAEAGALLSVGASATVTDAVLSKTLSTLLGQADGPARLSDAAFQVTDGTGAARVAEVLCPGGDSALRLRAASQVDAVVYFRWLNDPETRRQAFQAAPVAWADHAAWFDAALKTSARALKVVETPAGVPVGQVRFDGIAEDAGIVSFGLDPVFRGRGWGTRLLDLARESWAGAGHRGPLHGFVKPANTASLKAFRRAGFQDAASPHVDAPAGAVDMIWAPSARILEDRSDDRPF